MSTSTVHEVNLSSPLVLFKHIPKSFARLGPLRLVFLVHNIEMFPYLPSQESMVHHNMSEAIVRRF